jgi:hypothetical protein
MVHYLTPLRRPRLALVVCLSALLSLALAQASYASDEPLGSPKKAEVRFKSLIGVPPEGYSLFCVGLSACNNTGTIDLTTEAEVEVTYDRRKQTAAGSGPLDFASADGEVTMTFSCEGDPEQFRSNIEVAGTEAGELEIAGVRGEPGSNSLAVALNHGGRSGADFPQEIVDRSDGGCGTPVQNLRQSMGTWYYNFYAAHRGEQQEIGNDLELTGLKYDDGVFAKTYERFFTMGTGAYAYETYERTRIEVEPEYCAGKEHRVVSAVADGRSLGLEGMRFFEGQVVSAPPKTRIRLGDGSVIELERGGKFEIADCEKNATVIELNETLRSIWIHVKKAVAGSDRKFDVVTERAVAGVRGTIFEVSYNKRKQLTRVSVEESSVSLRGRKGVRGKVIIKAGRIGIQKGKARPRLLKG